MSQPRPESRISSLEQRASTIEAQIIEMSADTAEELKAIRQEIKQLNEGMMSSFKELGTYFELTEKAMATKDDITALRNEMKTTMATKDDIKNMATKDDIAELKTLMMQLLQQKPPES